MSLIVLFCLSQVKLLDGVVQGPIMAYSDQDGVYK